MQIFKILLKLSEATAKFVKTDNSNTRRRNFQQYFIEENLKATDLAA